MIPQSQEVWLAGLVAALDATRELVRRFTAISLHVCSISPKLDFTLDDIGPRICRRRSRVVGPWAVARLGA